ncbi:MAG: hypothetical protein QF464_06960, partial [Myxococcota bacterium]|nr:hypothetical protein [Myxococcota bacterium]
FTAAAAHLDRWTWPRSTRWWPAFDVGKMYAKNGHEKTAVTWFEDALRETDTGTAARTVRSWLSYSRVKAGTPPRPKEAP